MSGVKKQKIKQLKFIFNVVKPETKYCNHIWPIRTHASNRTSQSEPQKAKRIRRQARENTKTVPSAGKHATGVDRRKRRVKLQLRGTLSQYFFGVFLLIG